ncbi:hypothetical protein HYFRA_00002766 [Hymenoscyphus fraxineus]|uniref:Glycosyltransferase family 31 protein n=1 Tax=Hymenoscyphus fraxineus TaxID=746836 RepID=A0A9N9PQK4_9HELO|nr:hypothetical protein HYFRA_00002766 [Hymenoscyphus fraxineus]
MFPLSSRIKKTLPWPVPHIEVVEVEVETALRTTSNSCSSFTNTIMGNVSSCLDIRRLRRSALLPVALFMLGFIWFFQFLSATSSDRLLKPAKGLYDSVTAPTVPVAAPWTNSEFESFSHLEKLHLTENFSYSRRTIKTKSFQGRRPELTNLNDTKLSSEPVLMSAKPEDLQRVTFNNDLPVLTLDVPKSPKVNTAGMKFGIATNVDRLPGATPQFQHWLANTESTLNILVPPSDDIAKSQQQMRDVGINATIKTSDLGFPQRYFSLVKELYEARAPQTKWLVLMDDDTFITSLPALIAHLDKHYDAEEERLVAALSDNIQQVKTFGLIPFGGGGIFISVPLAAKLTETTIWNLCMEIGLDQGDGIVAECVFRHSAVRPTFDPYFNQMDFSGSPDEASGYFESGRRMLTIHHWRSWFDINMPAVSTVSKACGDEGVLMRWLFADNVVLHNGFTIAEYPQGITGKELSQVEFTWPDEPERFIQRIGPLRPAKTKEEKKTIRMEISEIIKDVGVRQTYVERAPKRTKAGLKKGEKIEESVGDDRVVELMWLFK